jgi:ABC-type transport system substrate-binding protein
MAEPDPQASDIADILADNMKAIGLKAFKDTKPSDTVYTTLRENRWDWQTAVASGPRSYQLLLYPEDMIYYDFNSIRSIYPGFNVAGFNNATFDAISDQMRVNFNKTQMYEQLYQLQEILASEVPMVGLCMRHTLNLYRDDYVTGWVPVTGAMYLGHTSAGSQFGINNYYTFESIHEASPGISYNRGGTVTDITLILIIVVVVICAAAISVSVYFLRKRRKKLVE